MKAIATSAVTAATLWGCLLWAPAPAGEVPSGDGLVSFWDFDDSLQDTAGRAADHLAARGGRARFVSAAEVPGTVAGAVVLGVKPDDAGLLAAKISPDIQLGPNYTIEAWIRPTQVGGWNRLVLQWGGPPQYAYHVGIHDGRASLCHNQANGEYFFAEGGHIVADRWYHLAAVAQRNDANTTSARCGATECSPNRSTRPRTRSTSTRPTGPTGVRSGIDRLSPGNDEARMTNDE